MRIGKSTDVTVKQRILLHLARFPGYFPGDDYTIPFDLTQDGIASVVGITRAHASIDLKKLSETGYVIGWQAHLKGSRSKRYVYALQPKGTAEAESLREEIENAGMTVDALLDMKRCDPEVKWRSLSAEDRETFGKACVLRMPVPRHDLPSTRTGVIPADYNGNIQIARETADMYLSKAGENSLRSWHCWAADYWLDRKNRTERLFHLISAGRNLEANWLAVRMKAEVLFTPSEDLLKTLTMIVPESGLEKNIAWLCAQTAIGCRNMQKAREMAEKLRELDSPEYLTVISQIYLMTGNYRESRRFAENAFNAAGGVLPAVVLAESLLHIGDIDRAEEYAIMAGKETLRILDGAWIDEILRIRARIAYAKGNTKECLSLLRDAWAAAPDCRRTAINTITADIRSGRAVQF